MKDIPGVPREGPRAAPIRPRSPGITLQPRTYRNIQAGFDLIAAAVRPTLGPLPRLVVLERLKRTEAPEFLDDGATIARRIIEIEPRAHDAGAMLLRHALWQMRQQAGDGTATTAVLCQAILREGIRHVTQFDCNAMLLRAGLEKGMQAVRDYVRRQALPLAGRADLAHFAQGICQGDQRLAEILGEIFDMVGADGLIVVEGYDRVGLEREYIEGTYWKLSGWLSRLFVTEPASKRAIFEDAALLITDYTISDPRMLLPALDRCVRAGVKQLVIVASDISDAAIGLLASNNQAGAIRSMAVRVPKVLEMDRVAAIGDIAALTGGKPFCAAAYPTLDGFQAADLGHARRAWATDSLFGIYGGRGDPRQVRKRMAELRGMLARAENDHDRDDLRARIGRLHGGTVILRVGGIHETEREARKTVAERAVTSLRNAVLGGVVPGGGATLVRAQSALSGLPAANPDEAAAFRILSRALEEPLRAIAANAGFAPDVVAEKVRAAPDGSGFDARDGAIADLRQRGILDSATVLEKAIGFAVSGAAMALTTDIVVHHRQPTECVEP